MTLFQPIISAWLAAIKIASDEKKKRFGRDADLGMKFLSGPYDWLFNEKELGSTSGHPLNQGPDEALTVTPMAPSFRMQINKVQEYRDLFGPILYSQNPARFCEPRAPVEIQPRVLQRLSMIAPPLAQQLMQQQMQGNSVDAVDEVVTTVKELYLNATPKPFDLKTESRRAIDEALIKGASTLWPEYYRPPGANAAVVASFHVTIDNIIIDTAMPTLKTAKWVVRRYVNSVYECAKKFGLDPAMLKGKFESAASQAAVSSGGQEQWLKRARESSYDMVVWYEVYSKCGLSGHMKQQMPPETQRFIDQVMPGEYAYLAICEGCPFPLNCPPQAMQQATSPEVLQQIGQLFNWPVPYYADNNWPFAMVSFKDIPNDPWPLAPLAPAMSILKFLNWFHCFVAGKILITSRTFIAIKKAAKDALKAAIRSGADLSVIELEAIDGPIADIVQFLDHPMINGDVYKIAQIMEAAFERATGMSELLYGQSAKQYRSAAEAEIKSDAVNVRPEEMANQVEDAMGLLARLEQVAMRFMLTGQDVAFMCGPVAGQIWQQLGMQQPYEKSLYETTVRIEAGSIRKPNRSRDAENVTAFNQQFGQFFTQMAMGGAGVEPFNEMMRQWCKVRDMDPTPFLLVPAPTPPPLPEKQAA